MSLIDTQCLHPYVRLGLSASREAERTTQKAMTTGTVLTILTVIYRAQTVIDRAQTVIDRAQTIIDRAQTVIELTLSYTELRLS